MIYCKTILSIIIFLCSFSAIAEDIFVDTDSDIEALLLEAEANEDILIFEPGVYNLNIELNKDVDLKGWDTTNTILISADGTNPAITVDGVNNISIRNFTFRDSALAIQVLDSSTNIDIENNAFHDNTIAIDLGTAVQTNIENNTFYKNNTAIAGPDPEMNVQVFQNIFQNNTETLVRFTIFDITYNCFSEALVNVTGTNNNIQETAGFADEENDDFHLTVDSGCIDMDGNIQDYDNSLSDFGAYGGRNSDLIPNAIIIDDLTLDSINWIENRDYRVAGYKIYYSLNELKGINSFSDRESTAIVQIDVGNSLSSTITDLDLSTVIPDTPILLNVTPRDKKLLIEWRPSANVTSYSLYYRVQNSAEKFVTVNEASSYTLTGLDNEAIYDIWLVAHYQKKYHFQVAAYLDSNTENSYRESSFIREDSTINIGELTDSLDSNIISASPEKISAYPLLPNEGCFIATAAFGFYSADEVQVLRDFRDQYLLTSKPGIAFVRWYYEYSPTAAKFINRHDFIKPVVRAALYPLIISAQLLKTNILLLIFILLTTVAGSVITLQLIFNNYKKAPFQ